MLANHARHRIFRLLPAALLLIASEHTSAQQVWSTFHGVVQAQDAKPVSGATVEAKEVATGVLRTTTTNTTGEFVFKDIPAGTYDISVSVAGFAPASQRVTLKAAQTHNGRFTLLPPGTKTGTPGVKVVEWRAADVSEFERRLGEPSAAGLTLVNVIPIAAGTSLVVLGGPSTGQANYTLVQIKEPLRPDTVARHLDAQPGKRLVGIHRLQGDAYLLVLQ